MDFHLKEVSQCKDTVTDEILNSWRSGIRNEIPSPDGRLLEQKPHPLAGNSDCSILEAWEISRPWFVDPDAPPFSMNAIHPRFFFQGEYDLVYRWNGRIRIIDLKASIGSGDRSGDYVEQLRMYAMLWWVTHGYDLQVDGLEIWYLGAGVNKQIAVPSNDELKSIEKRCEDLWNLLKKDIIGIESCPPNPAPLRGFSEGGVPSEPPEESRCERCEWSNICPGGVGDDDFQKGAFYKRSGEMVEYDLTPLEDLKPRVSIFAEVFSISKKDDYNPDMSIMQGTDYAQVRILSEGTWPENLSKGDKIRLIDVIPGTDHQGRIILKVDPFARIEISEESEDGDVSLLGFRVRWNVSGRVAYKTQKSGFGRNGRPWSRKGLVIFNGKTSIKVEGWDNQWPSLHNVISPGDEVVVISGSLDAWAVDVRISLERGSTIHRI